MSREATVKKTNFWERNKQTGNHLLKKRIGEYTFRIVRTLLLFGLCFLILQPLFSKLSVSFMDRERDLFDATVISIPRNFTLANYRLLDSLLTYWKTMWNSLWVALLVAALQVVACTIVGYGFARFKFPFKNFWFACVILVIVVPPQTISTPMYLNFGTFDVFGIFKAITHETLNLRNKMAPYMMMCVTCMGLKSGLYIYLLRQYFRGIPKELEEAAYVDGCGTLQTFIRIMLPDAKAMITSCFLFAFVWQWTDYFYTKLFLGAGANGKIHFLSQELSRVAGGTTVGAELAKLQGIDAATMKVDPAVLDQAISTGILMAVAPLIILYLFAQKGFVESLSQTGIKM